MIPTESLSSWSSFTRCISHILTFLCVAFAEKKVKHNCYLECWIYLIWLTCIITEKRLGCEEEKHPWRGAEEASPLISCSLLSSQHLASSQKKQWECSWRQGKEQGCLGELCIHLQPVHMKINQLVNFHNSEVIRKFFGYLGHSPEEASTTRGFIHSFPAYLLRVI